ncbi:MBL fold metallo-hydrolase [Candidatus Pelagibacter bacterium]|jgi:sulfur dioxygenase|nr:MBL fold metallo-hydrolase [Candidatus Pelagibacter bacterium]
MIFNQLFDPKSHTYTYIISSGKGREALIIDPVIEKTHEYLKILENLDLKLVKVIDTHIHADHVSGLNELNKMTNCTRIMGDNSPSEVVDIKVKDGEKVKIEDIELTALHTPGHTICSFSFFMKDRVFTGDTLLINGTGRTDFQGGSAKDQYDSIFNRLLKLPDQTVIYPAHDYNGKKNSTIIEEKKNNPRLQVKSIDEYIEIMKNLKLDKPNMMDFHVSSNIKGLIK